eukprot:980734-Prorocentrum_minimum.AAC.8
MAPPKGKDVTLVLTAVGLKMDLGTAKKGGTPFTSRVRAPVPHLLGKGKADAKATAQKAAKNVKKGSLKSKVIKKRYSVVFHRCGNVRLAIRTATFGTPFQVLRGNYKKYQI